MLTTKQKQPYRYCPKVKPAYELCTLLIPGTLLPTFFNLSHKFSYNRHSPIWQDPLQVLQHSTNMAHVPAILCTQFWGLAIVEVSLAKATDFSSSSELFVSSGRCLCNEFDSTLLQKADQAGVELHMLGSPPAATNTTQSNKLEYGVYVTYSSNHAR